MKNKLAAWLAALLLTLSLLPSQATAVFDPPGGDPLTISEQEKPETPDTPDNPEESESPAPQPCLSAQSEDPELTNIEH